MSNNNNIPNSFDLPDGYFKSSKAGILHKIEWMQEHEVFPTLLSLGKVNCFVVPENYFNASASKLELLDAPILAGLINQNGFEVPDNYFEKNITRITSLVTEEDELVKYPKLASIQKTNPFITGDDYFEKNKSVIIKKGSDNGGAKILSLFTKPMRYAAAAVLMIAIGLWLYNSFFKTETIEGDCTTLACLEKREIMKYKLENFDTEEILDDNIDLNKLEMNLNKKENVKSDSLRTTDSINEALLDYID